MTIMTHPDSDSRYHTRPAKPDYGLTPHLAVHGVVAALYLLSTVLAWSFDFHPFSASLHGYLMVFGGLITALLAFGPSLNARDAGDLRRIHLFKRYTSPILGFTAGVGLIALWIFAFSESFAGSIFA